MNSMSTAALVQPVRNPYFRELERRGADRQACSIEATSRPHDADDAISWGAMVQDISPGGLSLNLCYPFKPGTYLAVDLQCPDSTMRSLVVRVVHVHDEADGQWRLGCEFLKGLSQSDMDVII